MSALIGLTWLLVFGIFRDKIAVYRTRLVRTYACTCDLVNIALLHHVHGKLL